MEVNLASLLSALGALQPCAGLWSWLLSPRWGRGATGAEQTAHRDCPACLAAKTGPLLHPSPVTAATPRCLPRRPGHGVPPAGIESRGFMGPPSDPRRGGRRRNLSQKHSLWFLGENHRRVSLGWQNPQSHHTRHSPGAPWPPRPVLARDSTGSILGPSAVLSSSNPGRGGSVAGGPV